jgi:membrane protease YdiL (CAAX protease family)
MLNAYYLPTITSTSISFAKNFISPSCITGLSSISAVKIAAYLRSVITKNFIPGFVCGPTTTGDTICRYGSVGKMAIPVCAERIHSIQPLKPIFDFIGAAVNRLSSYPAYLSGFAENSLLNTAFLATGEELFCRVLIQRVLIRKAQEQVLKRLSPNYKNLIDHSLMKATRICAASIIFGLLHTKAWQCGYGGTIPEITGGIVFGALAESKYGLIGASLSHTLANAIIG